MKNRDHLKPSDYRLRGYTSLHIKIDTKSRLNIAKTQIFQRDGSMITHDDLINRLLDEHSVMVIGEPEHELA